MNFRILIILCLLLTAFTVVDIAPNPISANGIYTVESCKIRMESEIVQVDLFPERSKVHCSFKMVNHGEATSLEVGFPVMDFHHWAISGYSETDKANFEIQVDNLILSQQDIKVPKEMDSVYNEFMTVYRLQREHRMKIDSTYRSHNVYTRKNGTIVFPKDVNRNKLRTTIDSIHDYYFDKTEVYGKLISDFHELTENGKFPWYVWDVSFEENETRIIEVSYELPSGLAGKNAFRYFKYILNTGAGWYMDIGSADVILNLNDINFEDIEELKPVNYLLDKENKKVTWSFENLEPTEKDDIYFQYTIPREKRKYEKWKRKMDRKFKN